MSTTTTLISQIIATGQRLDQKNLVAAHAGNLSCRLTTGYLITAAGVAKGSLTPAAILQLDAQGQALPAPNARPSSETAMHLAIYDAVPQIQAIIHAHPPYATALATAERPFDWQLLEEARLLLGPVPILPLLSAGSAELAAAAAQAAPGHKALLLAGHGALCFGETLQEALFRLEALEHCARIMLYTGLFREA